MYQTKIRGGQTVPVSDNEINMEFVGIPTTRGIWREKVAYSVVDDILSASIIVYVDGDAAQGGYFGGELL